MRADTPASQIRSTKMWRLSCAHVDPGLKVSKPKQLWVAVPTVSSYSYILYSNPHTCRNDRRQRTSPQSPELPGYWVQIYLGTDLILSPYAVERLLLGVAVWDRKGGSIVEHRHMIR